MKKIITDRLTIISNVKLYCPNCKDIKLLNLGLYFVGQLNGYLAQK